MNTRFRVGAGEKNLRQPIWEALSKMNAGFRRASIPIQKGSMSIVRISLAIGVAGLFAFSLVGGPVTKEHPTRPFMRQKLSYSQGILEGITLERYELVVSNAVLLRNMNLTNLFLEMGNPYYRSNITSFQLKVDALLTAAKVKNPDSILEAYSEVVGSCTACHKEFRLEQLHKRGF
jgi:hypothetical protein